MGFYLKSYHEFKNVADYIQYGRLDEVCGPKGSIDRESQKTQRQRQTGYTVSNDNCGGNKKEMMTLGSDEMGPHHSRHREK